MAPCELTFCGIIRQLGIYGPTINRPLFEVIPFLPTESLTKVFWVNRLRTMYLNQLIEIDKENENDHNVLFTLLVVLIHFPETFYEKSGINLGTLYDQYSGHINSRTKRILIAVYWIRFHTVKDLKNKSKGEAFSAQIIEILEFKAWRDMFTVDIQTEKKIQRVKEYLSVIV